MTVVLISIVNPLTQFQKANDAKRKEDLAGLQKTLEAYYSDNGRYPPQSASGYKINDGTTDIGWGATWTAYNTKLPKDPSSSNNYAYYRLDTQTYFLFASLERGKNDPQVCNPDANPATDDACSKASTYSVTCGGTCDYGVSSSNTSP